jgi:hypothetical protein
MGWAIGCATVSEQPSAPVNDKSALKRRYLGGFVRNREYQ